MVPVAEVVRDVSGVAEFAAVPDDAGVVRNVVGRVGNDGVEICGGEFG